MQHGGPQSGGGERLGDTRGRGGLSAEEGLIFRLFWAAGFRGTSERYWLWVGPLSVFTWIRPVCH